MSEIAYHYASRHAQERALEHLGFSPTLEQWRNATLAIMDTLTGTPRAILQRQYAVNELWHVHLGPVQARVIWCPSEALIITVMP